MRIADRAEAGRQLGAMLASGGSRCGVLVLGLPSGGAPVAHAVARRLRAPLDVMPVRKLGVPDRPEVAMGVVSQADFEEVTRLLAAPARASPGAPP